MEDKRKCIVLIDDNDDFRNILYKYLTDSGYKVIEAENGLEGLYKVRDLDIKPNLFILDIIMDTLDGIDTYKLIKDNALLKHIPILLISGSEKAEKIKDDVEEEDIYFLSKPIVFSILSKMIKELLIIEEKNRENK
jgi:DNA-binding NtrC family response regulator